MKLNLTASFLALLTVISVGTAIELGDDCRNPSDIKSCDYSTTLLACLGPNNPPSCKCFPYFDLSDIGPDLIVHFEWNATAKKCFSKPSSLCSEDPLNYYIPGYPNGALRIEVPIECVGGSKCENIGRIQPGVQIGTCSSAMSNFKEIIPMFNILLIIITILGIFTVL